MLPKFDHLSLCSSSGALCLSLSHLLTLNSIPVQVGEAETLKAGTPKAFGFHTKEGCPFISITPLDGPLNTLQLLDENFYILTKITMGFSSLFDFKTKIIPTDSFTIVFASMYYCSQINGHSKEFKVGIPTPPGEDFKHLAISRHPQWFRSPLGSE